MKSIFIALTVCLGMAGIVAAAQAQQGYPLPQSPQSQPAPAQPTPLAPPPPADLANCAKQPAKMSITRAVFNRFRRTTSVLAPISTLASGFANVQLLGGGRITEFSLPVDSDHGLIRGTRGIDAAQARATSAILTLYYPGNADTRPQTLRLRAALRAARLSSRRPTISPTGQLDAAGAITTSAKGFVRVQLEWINASDGSTSIVERVGRIHDGRWGVLSQLPPEILSQINDRCSAVQSYVLFTGYQPLLMRGEMRAFQVAPEPFPTL